MKKLYWYIIAACMLVIVCCSMGRAADITLETLVPDAYVADVVEMLGLMGGQDVIIRVGSPRRYLVQKFHFEPKGAGESQIAYGQRYIKQFMLASLALVQRHKANARILADELEIDRSVTDVPDGSIGE